MGTPAGDGVHAGVLEKDAGQHHAQQRRQAADLADQPSGHGADHVHHEYGRKAAAGYGHQPRGGVDAKQAPRDGHRHNRGHRVGHGGRHLVVAPRHRQVPAAVLVELHARVVLLLFPLSLFQVHRRRIDHHRVLRQENIMQRYYAMKVNGFSFIFLILIADKKKKNS